VEAEGFTLGFNDRGLAGSNDWAYVDGFQWIHLYSDDSEQIRQALQEQLERWGVGLPHSWSHESSHLRHVLVEDYGDFFHLLTYHMRLDDAERADAAPTLTAKALHLVVHRRGVISWSARSVTHIELLQRKILAHPQWISDCSGLVFAILDGLFHALFPLLDELNEYIVQLEQHALTTMERKVLESRVLAYKHLIMVIRSVLVSSRDMAHGLSRRFKGPSVPYYFDLYDHVLRLVELVDGYRAMLDTVMDLHLSAVSNRMNEIVKTLTLVTTVMLPASLVAALYGMNFDHAPGIHWSYGFYCVLGFVGLVSAGLLVWFKRQAWI